MKLLLLTGPDLFEGEIGLLNQLLELQGFELGIRKPGWDVDGVEALASDLEPRHRSRIWLHGHPELALRLGYGGVHFGEKSKPEAPQWMDRLKKAGIKVCAACHDPANLPQMGQYDRVLLSPIFESISKPGHVPAFDLNLVQKALQGHQAPPEVFALGGITPARFGMIESLGFSGAVLLGAVWAAPDPFEALKSILNHPKAA